MLCPQNVGSVGFEAGREESSKPQSVDIKFPMSHAAGGGDVISSKEGTGWLVHTGFLRPQNTSWPAENGNLNRCQRPSEEVEDIMSIWVSFIQNLTKSLALGFSAALIPATHGLQTRKDTFDTFTPRTGGKKKRKVHVVFHDISFLFTVTKGFFLKEYLLILHRY